MKWMTKLTSIMLLTGALVACNIEEVNIHHNK